MVKGLSRAGLRVVSRGCRRASAAGPIGVEEFTPWLVHALVGMRTEIVALRLEQVRRKIRGAVTIEETQCR